MAAEKTIITGVRIYPIKNELGEVISNIHFNPTDSNLMHRFNEVDKYLKKLSESLPEDGSPTMEEEIALNKEIAEKFNYLTGHGAGNELFSYCGALTITSNGSIYCMNVLNLIKELIDEGVPERIEKFNKTVEKHTAEYTEK